jgi:Glycosyl transferases group 1
MTPPRVMAFANKGLDSNEGLRLQILLSQTPSEFVPFDHHSKLRSAFGLLKRIVQERPELVVMEGTGLAGGFVCLASRLLGSKYILSSGDSVGPFVASLHPSLGPVFGVYERLLCRFSAGFIGWTPYLVGRALSFGAPRGVSAPGWAASQPTTAALAESRERVRRELGIESKAIVFGIAGSLVWNRRVKYCYGWELLRAIRRVKRSDVVVLIIGSGTGLSHLREQAGSHLNQKVLTPGEVSSDRVWQYMSAFDVGSLPQSVDGVGSFRYTTKISEYLAAGVPIVTGRIPLSYDLDEGWLWRLPGEAPWDERYIAALADLMEKIAPSELSARRAAVPMRSALFDKQRQVYRVTQFIADVRDVQSGANPAKQPFSWPAALPESTDAKAPLASTVPRSPNPS